MNANNGSSLFFVIASADAVYQAYTANWGVKIDILSHIDTNKENHILQYNDFWG